MKRLGLTSRILPVLCIASLLIAITCAWGLQVPPLKGRVNDYAGLLSSGTARQLDAALAELESTDSTQIVVLTINSLEGDSLEDFSIRAVEQWRIGQKGKDNGVLLLVSKNDRKIRIEVGYGLEGKLTDLVSGRIIRNVMVPRFKMGHYDQGIIDGVAAIAGVVRGEYVAPAPSRRHGRRGASPGLVGLVVLFFFINMLGRIKRGLGAAAGGVLAPIAGALFLNLGLIGILSLIPIGAAAGFFMGLMGGPMSFGRGITSRRGGGFWGGGFGGGGFGGGGFGGGGFGGFSGGGGGFGGGGASGGW